MSALLALLMLFCGIAATINAILTGGGLFAAFRSFIQYVATAFVITVIAVFFIFVEVTK